MPKAVAFLAALALGIAPAGPRWHGACDRSAPASVVCERTHRLAPACAQGPVPCDSRPGLTAIASGETRRPVAQAPEAVIVAPLAAPGLDTHTWRGDRSTRHHRPLEHRPLVIALRV
jgi:hypothetical protein